MNGILVRVQTTFTLANFVALVARKGARFVNIHNVNFEPVLLCVPLFAVITVKTFLSVNELSLQGLKLVQNLAYSGKIKPFTMSKHFYSIVKIFTAIRTSCLDMTTLVVNFEQLGIFELFLLYIKILQL